MGRFQKGSVPPELVDEPARQQGALLLFQGHPCAQQRGIDPAAIDVAHQQHRGLRVGGHAHVDDVVLLEVHLAGAACPFQDHDLVPVGQRVVGVAHGLPEPGLVAEIFAGLHVPHGFAQDDDL